MRLIDKNTPTDKPLLIWCKDMKQWIVGKYLIDTWHVSYPCLADESEITGALYYYDLPGEPKNQDI